jgi:hypothetical protein
MLPAHAASIVERTEATAWWDLCQAVPAGLAREVGLSAEQWGEIVVSTCRRFDGLLMNRAFGFTAPCPESTLAALIGHFRTHRRRNYALQLSPLAQSMGIEAWLSQRGLARRNRWAIGLRGDQELPEPPSGRDIRLISASDGEQFARTAAAAYGWPLILARCMTAAVGRPGWRYYLAYMDHRPVATGALFSSGETAWLGIGGTIAEYRRHGLHLELLCRRVRDAIAMGCRWIVTETSEENPALGHQRQAGFQLLYMRDNYCEIPAWTDQLAGKVSGRARRGLRSLASKIRGR